MFEPYQVAEAREIITREDAALADHDPVLRDERRKIARSSRASSRRSSDAIVDPDHARLSFSARAARPSSCTSMSASRRSDAASSSARRLGSYRRHDDQDAIRAPGARLGHLIRLEHEVLAQRGQGVAARDAVRNSGRP